jgi:transcriptional regulator with XRE-family HTH domain
MLYREALGEVLRELRTDKRKNLVDVSKYVSIAHLSEIERGHNEVSSEVLENIADGLGVTVYDIVTLAGWKLQTSNEKQNSPTRLDKVSFTR